MQIKKIKLNTQNVFVHFKIDIFDWQIAENEIKWQKLQTQLVKIANNFYNNLSSSSSSSSRLQLVPENCE